MEFNEWEHWSETREAGLRMVRTAELNLCRLRRLGRPSVDEMLSGPEEPTTNENWPGASDMGEYLDRTIPDVAGRDVRGDR